MGAIWLLCGYHPLLSRVFPYLPMVQFHLNHLDAFVLCCLQCAHLETSLLPTALHPQVWSFSGFITCSCWFPRPGFSVGPKTESLGCWKNLWGEVDVTYTLRPAPGAQEMTPPSSEDFSASVWWPSCKLGQVWPSGSWCPPPCRPQGAALRSLCFCVVFLFIFIIALVISKTAL